jgi:hypothetical protein
MNEHNHILFVTLASIINYYGHPYEANFNESVNLVHNRMAEI